MQVNALFTNTSQNAQTYAWDFGDGGTSVAVNPSHFFATSGVYIVRLTATGAAGAATIEKPVVIQSAGLVNFLATDALEQLTDGMGNLIIVDT